MNTLQSSIYLLLPALIAPTFAQTDIPRERPHAKFQPPAMTGARWTGGFWGDRFDLVHKNTLPARTAYNETCANIAHGKFSRRMLALTGDARYGDMMERVLFNSMLSANSLDGKRFFYTNPLERRSDVPLLRQDAAERWPTWQCFCCPPSIARTIAGLGEWAWGIADGAIWLHLFGTGSLETSLAGSRLRVQQKSDYPWDGRIAITIAEAPPMPFALKLRIPAWAEGATVNVNGQPCANPRNPAPIPSSGARGNRATRWS